MKQILSIVQAGRTKKRNSDGPPKTKKSAQTYIYQIKALEQLNKVTTVHFCQSGLQKKYGTKRVFLGLFWVTNKKCTVVTLVRVVDYPTSNFTNTSQTAPMWVRLPLKCQISIKGCVEMYSHWL